MYNDVKDPLFIKVKSYMYTKSLKEFRPIIINPLLLCNDNRNGTYTLYNFLLDKQKTAHTSLPR